MGRWFDRFGVGYGAPFVLWCGIGLDVQATFGVLWVAANLAFGAVVVAAVARVAHRFPSWYEESGFIRALGE